VRHSITHRRITVHPVRLDLEAGAAAAAAGSWVDPDSPSIPTSSLFSKLLRISNLLA
jgi:hypothetical protein